MGITEGGGKEERWLQLNSVPSVEIIYISQYSLLPCYAKSTLLGGRQRGGKEERRKGEKREITKR